MPDRIIRGTLWESERFVNLPRNTHRLAFVALLTAADAIGNMEAADGHLWRIWRDVLRLDTRAAIVEILDALVGADLVRLYDVAGKRFLHIPRYRQRMRYLARLNPPSPWTTPEEKQRIAANSPGAHRANTGRAPGAHRVDVDVDVDVKQNTRASESVDNSTPATTTATMPELPEPLGDRSPEKPDGQKPKAQWWRTPAGIEQAARAIGVTANAGETHATLKRRVFDALANKGTTHARA